MMASIPKPIVWFYHSFGIDAIHDTGRNAYIIIAARMLRMLAHGANSLILGRSSFRTTFAALVKNASIDVNMQPSSSPSSTSRTTASASS